MKKIFAVLAMIFCCQAVSATVQTSWFDGPRPTGMKSVMNEIFHGQAAVPADRVTDVPEAAYGNVLRGVGEGYAIGFFEHYILPDIHKGELKKETCMDYGRYKKVGSRLMKRRRNR